MEWVTRAAVAAVAVVAAVVSYEHLQTVAEAAGESWRSWLLPLSVDGLVVAASLAAFRTKRNREPVHTMTKLSLGTGLVVSVAANVLVPFLPHLTSAQLSWLSATVAAWPAVALALAFEELLRLRAQPAEPAPTEEPEPLTVVPGPKAEPGTAQPEPEPEPVEPTPREAALRVALSEPRITGKALGVMFDRSDSWGRAVIREARETATAA